MGIYTFKHVPLSERNKLISFIDNYWRKDHALVKSEALLNFQHFNKDDDTYNFIVAENNETGEYDAIVGYIPLSQYDVNIKKDGNYWGAIWKCREDVQNDEINAAAFYVWKQLFKLPYFQSYGAIGISDIAKQIYIASRMSVGQLSQYYILNDKINSYSIAGNVTDKHFGCISNLSEEKYSANWVELSDVPDNITHAYLPQKTLAYFKQRYDNHPIYRYRYIGLYQENTIIAVLAVRIVEANGSKCIRIMDALGNLYGNYYSRLLKILYTEKCEYIDFMNYGISEEVFINMGFRKLNVNGDLIIPNYFEPFEQKNIVISLAYKSKFDGYVAFKGDSDQDRPNIL